MPAQPIQPVARLHADHEDTVLVRVEVTDGRGRVVPVADKAVGCQPGATNPAVDGQFEAKVTWKKGANMIVFALNTNHGKAWGLFCRAQFRTS